MNKILCLIVCMLLLTTFVSCETDNNDVSSNATSKITLNTGSSVSVKDYAVKGEIFNCEFKVGTSIEHIKDAYHYGDENFWGNASEVDSTELSESDIKHNIDATPLEILGEDPIRMITGDAKYYYHPDKEADGIAYVAYFGDAYGFRVGISEPEDIKKSVGEIAVFDDFAKEEDLFFFFGYPEGVYKLEYTFNDEYTLAFFFENGKLAATTIYKISLWT